MRLIAIIGCALSCLVAGQASAQEPGQTTLGLITEKAEAVVEIGRASGADVRLISSGPVDLGDGKLTAEEATIGSVVLVSFARDVFGCRQTAQDLAEFLELGIEVAQ